MERRVFCPCGEMALEVKTGKASTDPAEKARYHDLLDGRFDAILDAWRARAYGSRGAKVEWDSVAGVRTGITEGIDDMGALLVRSEQTLERIVAGEVRWGIYGSGR